MLLRAKIRRIYSCSARITLILILMAVLTRAEEASILTGATVS